MALVPLSGLLWHQAHIEGTYIRAGKMLIHKTKANKSFFKSQSNNLVKKAMFSSVSQIRKPSLDGFSRPKG